MDDRRFDRLAKRLHDGRLTGALSRRVALHWVLAALPGLGAVAHDVPADAKTRKKGRKKRRCTPNCTNRFCGPNSCGKGSCGSCGNCKNCEGGQCFPKADGTACGGPCEECQSGVCVPKAAGTPCGDCQECNGTTCESVCVGSEVCFAGSCEDLSGACAGSTLDSCDSGPVGQCSINGAGGQCVKLNDRTPFCYSELECGLANAPKCQTNADCVAQGFGVHAQCITDCDFCGLDGLPACVRLAGE